MNPRTRVILVARACDLGRILAALEHDTAIDVGAWRQNAPGVSREVEIPLRSTIFPREWADAEIGLEVRSNQDCVQFTWQVMPGCAGQRTDTIMRMRSMGRTLQGS